MIKPYTQINIKTIVYFGLAAVVGLIINKAAVITLITAVIQRQGSSHGIFVPFLSAYFIWKKIDVLKQIELRRDYSGMLFVAAGIALSSIDMGAYQLKIICLF